MRDTPALRKARGAFYTPPELTRYIADWAIRSPDDRVLEPSCGDAEFLLAAGRRCRELGGGLFAGSTLLGVELDWPSAEAARARLEAEGFPAGVSAGDFFLFEPNADPDHRWDAVVGNPPYIRYQSFAGAARSKALEAALEVGVRLTGLSSAWAPFVVHASRFLRPTGRLGLVLPAELLTVGYAAEIRRFLLERFATVRLIMFEELVFPDVQEEVVLLLAEGTGGATHFELYQARNLDALPDLHGLAWTAYAPDAAGKWSPALVATAELDVYATVLDDGGFVPLLDWGDTYLGIVTGGNNYFTVTAAEAAEHGFARHELLRISPPGSRHLRGLTFTELSWQELAGEGRRVYLIYPGDEPSPGALQYIAAGETAGVHKGYKCRMRTPWWRVPLVPPPDLLLTYMDKDRPRLVTNRAGVYALNSLYGVRLNSGLRRIGQDLLPIASLNSMTLLGAEVVGRAYGGGMLKLEPKEADRMPVPSVDLVLGCADELRALRPHLSQDLRQGKIDDAVTKVDRVLLTQGLGMTHAQIKALRNARATLYGRREARSNGNGAR